MKQNLQSHAEIVAQARGEEEGPLTINGALQWLLMGWRVLGALCFRYI